MAYLNMTLETAQNIKAQARAKISMMMATRTKEGFKEAREAVRVASENVEALTRFYEIEELKCMKEGFHMAMHGTAKDYSKEIEKLHFKILKMEEALELDFPNIEL